MKKFGGILLGIAITSFPAFGSVVYSNLNDANATPGTVSLYNQLTATEFLTDPGLSQLSGITVTLMYGAPLVDDELYVYFYESSDTGTYTGCTPNCPIPGTLVEQVGYVPYSTLSSLSTTTPTNVSVTMTALPQLPPSTDLWIVLESTQVNADDANVVVSQNATNGTDGGSNAAFQSLYHDEFGGGIYSGSWSYYDALNSAYPTTIPEIAINVIDLPEPATIALLGVSLIGLGLLRRGRRMS